MSERDQICSGGGKGVRFWLDVWLGDYSLKLRFSRLFDISLNQNWVVAQVLEGGRVNLEFRRNMEEEDILELRRIERVFKLYTAKSEC
jgi:hypothetical protein